MVWVNIIAVFILFFSLIGGLKEGAVKQGSNLLVLVIAIPLTGLSYRLLAGILSFLPGTNWESFFGFFITFALISAIFHIILLLPVKITGKIWKKGLLFRLSGGAFNLVNAGMGMTLFALILAVYPIIDWLERAVINAGVIVWLVEHLSFVQSMLPEIFQKTITLSVTLLFR